MSNITTTTISTTTIDFNDDNRYGIDEIHIGIYTIKVLSRKKTHIKGDKADINSVGQRIWCSTDILLQYIYNNQQLFIGKSVLELGCGPGVCGILCSLCGASEVLITDNEEVVLELAQTNIIECNEIKNNNINVQSLYWGNDTDIKHILEEKGMYDVIIASDVTYSFQHTEILIKTILSLLSYKQESFAVFIHEMRLWMTDIDDYKYNNNNTITRVDYFVNYALKNDLLVRIVEDKLINISNSNRVFKAMIITRKQSKE